MTDLVVIVAVSRLIVAGLINIAALYVSAFKKPTETSPEGTVHKLDSGSNLIKLLRLEKALNTAIHISAILYLLEVLVGE